MKLNQPYYLNVVLLKIFFKELRRFMKHFFTKCSKCHVRFSLHFFFFMKSHPLDQGLPSFKNPKLASCVEGREKHNSSQPLWFFSHFLFWGVWLPRKSNFPIIFQIVFNGFLWENDGLILHSFISQFLVYLGVGKNPVSSYMDSRRD